MGKSRRHPDLDKFLKDNGCLMFDNLIVHPSGKIYSAWTLKQRAPQLVARYHYVKVKKTMYRLHRIVAGLFIPNPNGYRTVNHKNGDKLDNRVENLEWCTLSENHKHAFKTGLRTASISNFKFTRDQVIEILNDRLRGMTITELCAKHNLSLNAMEKIIKGKSYRHYNLPKDLLEGCKQLNFCRKSRSEINSQRVDLQKKMPLAASEDTEDCGVYHSASIYPGNPGSFSFN